MQFDSESEIVVVAIKRTIRQYRKGHKSVSQLAMRELESVLNKLKRTYQPGSRIGPKEKYITILDCITKGD